MPLRDWTRKLTGWIFCVISACSFDKFNSIMWNFTMLYSSFWLCCGAPIWCYGCYVHGFSNFNIIDQLHKLLLLFRVDLESDCFFPYFCLVLDNTRKNSLKKNDDALPGHKGFVHYFSTLAIDYLSIVLPVLLIFTVSILS